MDKKGLGLVGILLFVTLFAFFFTAPVADHYSSVQHNEPTTATITETDIADRVNDDEREYRPVISYEYTVDGEQYQESNVYPGRFIRWHGSESTAQRVVDSYQVGSNRQVSGEEVVVYYDPKNPGNAYLRNDGLPDGWFVPIVYTVVAFLGGGHLFRQGIRRWRQRNYIADTPTETAQSLSIGPSELKGTVVSGDHGPLQAPFSEADCVVAKYEIEEYEDDDDDSGGSWNTIDSGVLHVPFYLDDGTGTVLIRPDDDATYDLDPDDWSTVRVDSSQRGPEPVQWFVENSDDVDFPAHSAGKENDRKYKQNLIRTGESAYIFGTVTERDEIPTHGDNADRLVVKRDESMRTPMFMISDDDEASLIDRRRWALWRLPVGAVFLVAGFTFFLIVTGPWLGLQTPRILDGLVGSVS